MEGSRFLTKIIFSCYITQDGHLSWNLEKLFVKKTWNIMDFYISLKKSVNMKSGINNINHGKSLNIFLISEN